MKTDGAGQLSLGDVTWSSVTGKPTFAAVATSGAYADLSGTPDLSVYAHLASPTFTGTPAAPTATPGTNTTQLATTAFVQAAIPVTSVAGRTGAITLAVADVSGAAPLASPTFTGTPAAPTAGAATNSTQLATTAFVKTAIDNLIAGAPGALDTLNEIATQLASDESAVSALTTVVASKVPATRTVNGYALSADVTLTTSDLSGTVTPAHGGTGLATLTAHAVLLGEGTSNVAFATVGTAGRLLIDQGASADPSFNAMSGDATITSSGAITVTKTNGSSFGTLATQSGTFSGTSSGTNTGDQTITLTGDVTGSGTGSFAATVAKIAGVAVGTPSGTGNVIFSASPTFTGTITVAAASFSGACTNSGASAASTAAEIYTGAIYAAGTGITNFPHILIQPNTATSSTTWSLTGTVFGANVHTSVGNFVDFQVDGTSQFRISGTGAVIATGSISATDLKPGASNKVNWPNKTYLSSPVDGQLLISNNGSTDFGRVMFGGTTSSFPALKRSTTTLQCRLADDSANAGFLADSFTSSAPTGGTAGAWKLGIRVAATVILDVTQYIQLDVGGTLYKIGVVA